MKAIRHLLILPGSIFSIFLAVTLGAQEAAADVLTAPAEGHSYLTLLLKGGPVMIPLALCSILAVTIAFERSISLTRQRVMPTGLIEELRENLSNPYQPNLDAAGESCQNQPGPFARIIQAGLEKWTTTRERIEAAVSLVADREIARMKRSIRGLRTVATVAPLLGLLGTVLGMIQAFQTVALSSGSLGRPEMLAEGIYEAMVTTAAGLTIAVPTLVLYFFLNTRVDRLADEIEEEANALLDLHGAEASAPRT